MWTIEQIESCGFKLLNNDKQWCHFRGRGYDVFINLEKTVRADGNYFNFHSLSHKFNGNFRAIVNNPEEMETLLTFIQYRE